MNTPVCQQKLVYEVTHDDLLLGMIISAEFREPGIHFFTPDSFSQQVAYMRHPAGKVIPPHVHNPVPRQVSYTQEVLVIKRGKLRVDFYSETQEYLESYILHTGDVIVLATGGHGFEILEEVEIVEVKQGPYAGDRDKTRFEPTFPTANSHPEYFTGPAGFKKTLDVDIYQ